MKQTRRTRTSKIVKVGREMREDERTKTKQENNRDRR